MSRIWGSLDSTYQNQSYPCCQVKGSKNPLFRLYKNGGIEEPLFDASGF